MKIDSNNVIKEIKKLEYKLNEVKSKSAQLKINNSLIPLYELYETLTGEEYFCDQPLELIADHFKYCSKSIKRYVNSLNNMIGYHYETSKNTVKIFNDIDFQNLDQISSQSFNQREALTILYDFFNNYDSTYYKLVRNMIENNQVSCQIINQDYAGICFEISELEKSYIIYNADNQNFNINSLSVMVHEFGHAIHNHLNHSNNYQQKINNAYTNYLEVCSSFFEKLFLEYCLDNKLGRDDPLFSINNMYSELLYNFIVIHLFSKSRTYNNNSRIDFKITCNIIRDLVDELDEEFSSIKSRPTLFDLKDEFIYGYGSLLGIHFAHQYKQDPSEVRKKLINFINKIGVVDNYKILNTCGLKAEQLGASKILKKELKKHREDIKNFKNNY